MAKAPAAPTQKPSGQQKPPATPNAKAMRMTDMTSFSANGLRMLPGILPNRSSTGSNRPGASFRAGDLICPSSARTRPSRSEASGLPFFPGAPALVSGAAPRTQRPGWTTLARLVGLVGAFFVAFSPFLVYYAQEARMYSLLASLGALASLALWKLLETGRPAWWWAYIGFTAAMLSAATSTGPSCG